MAYQSINPFDNKLVKSFDEISDAQLEAKLAAAVAYFISYKKRNMPTAPGSSLCRPGNNGGDRFVAARLLVVAGRPVRLALLGAHEHLAGEARHHAALWSGPVENLSPLVLGGAAAETLTAAAKRDCPVVAIDVPSGLMGDTGAVSGAVAAVLTVTCFRKKPGHLLLPARLLCGEVIVSDIGTPASLLASVTVDTHENDPVLWLYAMPRPCGSGNKYDRGHALVVGGYPMTGSARMAAHAAEQAGAGLTTIAVSTEALPVYAAALTSVMVREIEEPGGFNVPITDPGISGMLIGPGAGVGKAPLQRAVAMLATSRPVVIDADAITSFQVDSSSLDRAVKGICVLTPNDGEFERVFDSAGDKLPRATSSRVLAKWPAAAAQSSF